MRATEIRAEETFVLDPAEQVVRVHRLAGAFPMAWSDLRSWGPTPHGRFDHQPEPPRRHPTRSVAYGTIGERAVVTALAETFAGNTHIRPIDRHTDARHISVFALTREVTLLDLESAWLARAGGNRAVTSGPRRTARAWARAVYRHHPAIEGLVWRSSVYPPGRCVVLWDRAADAWPSRPLASRALSDPSLMGVIADAAVELGVGVI